MIRIIIIIIIVDASTFKMWSRNDNFKHICPSRLLQLS